MIELRDGQFVTVRQYGNKFYSCVCSKEGLVAYCEFPYLKVENGQPALNIDSFNKDLKAIANFDIANEINCVVNADQYRDFIQELQRHQYTLFNVEALVVHLEEIGCVGNNLYKQMTTNLNYVTQKVGLNEKVFTEQIVPSIPKNWPYAMFHESSWTAYESNINLCKFAQGEVTKYADVVGMKMKDIQSFNPEYRKEPTEKFNALNSEIVADIENGVYVFDAPETQTFDEPNSGNE